MSIATINPATGEHVRDFPPDDERTIEGALARAHEAARMWRRRSFAERTAIVRRAGELLEERKEHYGRIMTLEMGKPISAAISEAEKCAACCRYYADHAESMLADEPTEIEGERAFVAFQPLGVVLAVMPWNFPFWQVIRFAAPALCAGNVGILKHASNVPQCAIAIADLFREAGAPEGVFQTLLIGSQAVNAIIADDRVAAVTLTGSEHAGSEVAKAAGAAIKRAVLELGGSDPFIVMPSVDLDAAVATAVKARMINNGQSCIAAKRFIVHERIFEDFARKFAERVRALKVGDPTQKDTDIGPLATPQIRDDLVDQVQRTVDAGATVLVEGGPRPGPGNYFAPVVLTDVPRDSAAAVEETFGPVAPLFRVRDIDEAIALANDSRFGLGSAAWTNDDAEAERFARELEAGCVFINGMVASDPRMPFGGIKKSGFGRELGAFGIREFVNIKTVRRKS